MERYVKEARKAQQYAYVPYSQFPVGAALETSEGHWIHGCNIENASYGLTNCAERTALFKAISLGYKSFRSMTVVANTHRPVPPCGACRQVMTEFCPPDMPVYLVNQAGDVQKTTVAQLLPGAFNEEDLT